MKISIYLCDDNQIFIEKIENAIQHILSDKCLYELKSFDNGIALIDVWNEKEADVVFLDIDMPDMTGFDVAEKLQEMNKNVIIIFITSYEDKVYQSWDFQPFWFVRKSHLEDLEKVFLKLISKIDEEKRETSFQLIVADKATEININEIEYIYAEKHYVVFKNVVGEDIKIRCKISDIEEQLYNVHFIRIQKGVIVNCRCISKITSRDVILDNGDKIHISRDRLENARNAFQEFIRSRM